MLALDRHPWPTGDSCGTDPGFSLARFLFFSLIAIVLVPGSISLYMGLADRPYGLQFASAVRYTAGVILFTFSSQRVTPRPYVFSCPFVRSQLPRLTLQHVGYLAALFILLTGALHLRPYLPDGWFVPSGPRQVGQFDLILLLLCYGLGVLQVVTNRSILKRAHLDYNLN
jgi:hypothetical protein